MLIKASNSTPVIFNWPYRLLTITVNLIQLEYASQELQLAQVCKSLGTAHQMSVILFANRPTWGMYYKILRIPFYGKGGKLSRNLWINFLRNRFTLKFGKMIEN